MGGIRGAGSNTYLEYNEAEENLWNELWNMQILTIHTEDFRAFHAKR